MKSHITQLFAKMNLNLSLLAGLFLITGVLALPILSVLWVFMTGQMSDEAHLWQTILPPYLQNTIVLMLLVSLIATAIGVSCAWIVASMDFPGRKLFSWLLILPLASPAYIIAYIYTDFLDTTGPVQTGLRSLLSADIASFHFPEVRSIPGAAILLGLVLYPYIYVVTRTSFSVLARNQFQAARSLGRGPWAAFFKVALPSARLAIFAGLSLVLMETLADFGVADYFAIPTLSTGVFRTWLAMGDKVTALKIAGVMLLFAFILIVLEKISRRGKLSNQDQSSNDSPLFKLNKFHSGCAIIVCSLPIMLGFALPVGLLALNAISYGDQQSLTALIGYTWNSISVALFVTLFAIGISLFLVYANRSPSPNSTIKLATQTGIRISTIGYALPGTVLAVGLLMPIGPLDQFLTGTSRNLFGTSHGLLLTGSISVLVYALTVRFLTVSYNGILAGSEKITPSMDAAARSLGASSFQVFKRIHFPLLKPSIAASACLVFIDVIKELPATLILRPFNFETLATRVYRLASDERLNEASTAALLIVIVGLIPTLTFNRIQK
ncbi:ABC transporter permease [Hirschia maritima]|uniref:ABC transporter permease n=1 Tax=Hirschia maritima TaxID=1121961 RepID=UPI000378ECDA|nr:iron ABC transporter permease [Hirschia maritima]